MSEIDNKTLVGKYIEDKINEMLDQVFIPEDYWCLAFGNPNIQEEAMKVCLAEPQAELRHASEQDLKENSKEENEWREKSNRDIQ